jgi:redox-sensing transcriptional repressor
VADEMVKMGITGFWNFTGKDIEFPKDQDVILENVHLGDSLMSLNYRLCQRKEALDKKDEG